MGRKVFFPPTSKICSLHIFGIAVHVWVIHPFAALGVVLLGARRKLLANFKILSFYIGFCFVERSLLIYGNLARTTGRVNYSLATFIEFFNKNWKTRKGFTYRDVNLPLLVQGVALRGEGKQFPSNF